MSNAEEKPLDVSQVAELLNTSYHTVRRHIRAGRLKAHNIGTGIYEVFRVYPSDLEEFKHTILVKPSPNVPRSNYSAPDLAKFGIRCIV